MTISSSNWNLGVVGRSCLEVVKETWYLGFTAFGGPPVHFKIFHDKFVTKIAWVDEQMYQELFAVCQAFSGPASTKLLYTIILLHTSTLPAILGLIIWSLPGALGMYALALRISNISSRLPRAVYALLSGLTAATVGTIALAAVQLSQKAITDKLTRILVFMGATAGLMYNALWYFPLLMGVAGIVSMVFDYRLLHPAVKWTLRLGRKKQGSEGEEGIEMSTPNEQVVLRGVNDDNNSQARPQEEIEPPASPRIVPASRTPSITWKTGTAILAIFFVSFITMMVLRGTLPYRPLLFSLFSNMALAGTIIFGGGPVVIPLLREYVVDEGWVSPRDFLIGLVMIQAFPGPNFNFAVYLGALTAVSGGRNAAIGAVLGYLGIFMPGIVMVHGTVGVWSAIRRKRWVKAGLRGVNAAAVGLIYTAVYRLWQMGYVDVEFHKGRSLGDDPWWVVVGATSYVGGMWFNVPPAVAIGAGAVMGLIRYGVVSS